jgi:hypothetical protein
MADRFVRVDVSRQSPKGISRAACGMNGVRGMRRKNRQRESFQSENGDLRQSKRCEGRPARDMQDLRREIAYQRFGKRAAVCIRLPTKSTNSHAVPNRTQLQPHERTSCLASFEAADTSISHACCCSVPSFHVRWDESRLTPTYACRSLAILKAEDYIRLSD